MAMIYVLQMNCHYFKTNLYYSISLIIDVEHLEDANII